jgi:hypothetical protein
MKLKKFEKIEKFKDFPKKLRDALNDDTPNEIILPDLNTEELEKEKKEMEDELEITEDVDWDQQKLLIKTYGEEAQSYLETLFAEITEEGYYEFKVVLASASPESLSRSNRIYIDSEIKLEPIEGKLWFRPAGMVKRFDQIIIQAETSFERESEFLRIRQRNLNKINAIIEDLKSDGCEVKMYSNRVGEIQIKIREKLDI